MRVRTTDRSAALLALVLVAFGGDAAAANRCTDPKGRVTYQDAACSKDAETGSRVDTSEAFSSRPVSGTHPRVASEPPASLSPSAGSAGDYMTYRGAWRGPLQFEVSLNGLRDGDAHTISPIVLEIRPDGEVVGQASASGCRFSGLATQNVAPYIASLDVSLKGCTDPRFNTRLSGNLVAINSSKEAKLRLIGLVAKPAAPLTVTLQQVSLDGVLKR